MSSFFNRFVFVNRNLKFAEKFEYSKMVETWLVEFLLTMHYSCVKFLSMENTSKKNQRFCNFIMLQLMCNKHAGQRYFLMLPDDTLIFNYTFIEFY